MLKRTILPLLFLVFAGESILYAQGEKSLLETDFIEVSGFFDVKTTDFTFKKVDENHRIVAFTKDDLTHLQTFFESQEGVLKVKGDHVDKTIQVISLLEKEGQVFFEHREIAEILNRDGFITIRLRTRTKSQYLAAIPSVIEEDGITAELTTNKEKTDDCNTCGDQKVSQDVLDLLKNMDFGGEMFNISTDSTSQQSKPLSDMK